MAPSFNIPSYFTPTTDYIAEQEGLDPDFFERMLSKEGAFNPNAGFVSPAGALGPAQLMPGTAADLGVDPYDEVENLFGGARYLKDQLDEFGNPTLAAAAYNAGPGAVKKYGGVPPFKETIDYAKDVGGEGFSSALPKIPDFSPSKYADIELGASAMPSPTGRRSKDLERVGSEIDSLQKQRDEALAGLGNQNSLESGDTWGIILSALLPTLAGWATGGLQGAAMGADAGSKGATTGLSMLNAQNQNKQAVSKLLYENSNQQLTQKQAERRALEGEERQFEDTATRDARLYGAGGFKKPAGSQSYSTDISDALADAAQGKKLTPDQMKVIYQNPRATDDYAKIVQGQDVDRRATNRADVAKRGQIAMGYKDLPGAPTLTTTEQRDMRTRLRGTEAMIDNLDQQKELLAQNGTFDVLGTSAAVEKMLQSEFMNLGRIRTASGATFTPPEMEFVNALQAATAAGTSTMDALRDLFTGRNALEMVEAAQGILKRGMDVEMLSYGKYNPEGTYSDDLKTKYKIGLDSGTNDSKPAGAVGKKSFTNKNTGEKKVFWYDAQGTRLSEAE